MAQDLGWQRPARLRADRAAVELRRAAAGRARLRPRGRTPRAGGRHDHLVAQGPRPHHAVRRLQPERRDHTIASAYSVRGVPEATVSTPIGWDEVDDVQPREFTIATVPARFAELGDLHQGIDDSAYSLDTLLEWAERDGLD